MSPCSGNSLQFSRHLLVACFVPAKGQPEADLGFSPGTSFSSPSHGAPLPLPVSIQSPSGLGSPPWPHPESSQVQAAWTFLQVGEAGPASTDRVSQPRLPCHRPGLLPGNPKDASFPLGPPGALETGTGLSSQVSSWSGFVFP